MRVVVASPAFVRARTAAWIAPLLDIIAGTLGGAAGKLIEFPFDTVKVRLQASGIGALRRTNGEHAA